MHPHLRYKREQMADVSFLLLGSISLVVVSTVRYSFKRAWINVRWWTVIFSLSYRLSSRFGSDPLAVQWWSGRGEQPPRRDQTLHGPWGPGRDHPRRHLWVLQADGYLGPGPRLLGNHPKDHCQWLATTIKNTFVLVFVICNEYFPSHTRSNVEKI